MERNEETPRCANQVHLAAERGRSEPSTVCSCPAGLVHMHDCPVSLGLPCVHFRPLEAPPPGVPFAEYERLHDALMQDYLSRTYFHRIRRLAPDGHPWQRRRDEIAAGYAEAPETEPPEPEEDADYERERERLIALRKEREAIRQEREEKTREERAQERARMGIKTVVERARETVAQQGNVTESMLDGVELPPEAPRRRRGRRGGAGEGGGGGGPEGQPGPRRRRRRRRRGGGGGGPPPAPPPG